MDLQFPHHDCEIAQSRVAFGHENVRYWMHNNMVTINGQKMARSLGNFITLDEIFSGDHPLLEQSYSPMTVRFFILQAHYRSTLDFSNEALQAAAKGLERLMKAGELLEILKPSAASTVDVGLLEKNGYEALNDDLNTPVLIAHLFDSVRMINSLNDGNGTVSETDLSKLKRMFHTFVFDILGLKLEISANEGSEKLKKIVDLILRVRQDAKARKEWALSDYIRDELGTIGIAVKDKKDGFEWEFK
jgi:cysteinyl-tRNA synthetase